MRPSYVSFRFIAGSITPYSAVHHMMRHRATRIAELERPSLHSIFQTRTETHSFIDQLVVHFQTSCVLFMPACMHRYLSSASHDLSRSADPDDLMISRQATFFGGTVFLRVTYLSRCAFGMNLALFHLVFLVLKSS